MISYFDLPEVSNSDFTSLERAFNGLSDNRDELEDIFNFGSLVDGMLFEPFRVSEYNMTLTDDRGIVIQYTASVFNDATKLAYACKKDPILSMIIKHMKGQYIFRRRLLFDFDGEDYVIKARCKFDAFGKAISMGAEFKTTACETKKSFLNAIAFFNWDRAAAFYMDIARIDRHWIIGISKKNGQIFKHAVQRGDEIYESGRRKYSLWAYRWLMFVDGFKTINT